MMPNFFILGAPKCGTTSLAAYCAQHDRIFVPSIKESALFSGGADVPVDSHYAAAIYRKGKSCEYLCDATPTYLANGRSVIPKMLATYSVPHDLKFLIILRNPVDRFISHYKHNYYRGSEPRGIDEVAESEVRTYRQDPERIESLEYLSPGFYDIWVPMWIRAFDKSQFLILSTDELNDAKDLELNKIWQFLNIEPPDGLSDVCLNVSGRPRIHNVNRWAFNSNAFGKRIIRRILSKKARAILRQLILNLNTLQPVEQYPISAISRDRLAQVYGSSIEAMKTYTDTNVL